MDISTIHIAVKLVDFTALFTSIGLLLARLVLLPSAAFDIPSVTRKWHRLLGVALILLAITGLLLLLVRVMQMSGMRSVDAIELLPSVLRQTHFGKAWALHLFGLFLLGVCWGAHAQMPRHWAAHIMLAILYSLALTYSATSHAADAGDFTVSELNDWVHLAAAASWGGGIFATLLLIVPSFWEDAYRNRKFLNDMLRRLSTLSAVALAFVVISGATNMAARVGGLDNLLNSSYGHVLIGKLLLVAVMVAIGGINRLVLIPGVERWVKRPKRGDPYALRWLLVSLRVDAILVFLILTVASVLIQGMPPVAKYSMPGKMEHPHE